MSIFLQMADISILADSSMSVPVSWVLASGAALAAAISGLAKMLYNSQAKQIELLRDEIKAMREVSKIRSETIAAQNQVIVRLQQDICDLKKGCGHDLCHFKTR